MAEGQRLRILILEDRPADAELVVHELRRAGFEPEWTRVDSEHAFTTALASSPDVILADYNVPGFDGLQALEYMRRSDHDIPVILVSGSVGEDIAVGAIKLGAADYLLKDRLVRIGPAVRQALEQKRLREAREQAEEALGHSERRFRALIERASEGIALIDPSGTILYRSPGAERVLGRRGPMDGRSIFEAVHPEDLPQTQAAFQQLLSPGQPEASVRLQIRVQHQNGSWRWVHVIGTNLLEEPAVGAIVLNYRDVTEQVQAEAQAIEQLQRLTTLHTSAQQLSRSLSVEELSRDIVRTAVDVFGVTMAAARMANEDGSVHTTAHYPPTLTYPAQVNPRWDETEAGMGATGQAIRSGFPVIVGNGTGTPVRSETLVQLGIQSVAALPLVSRDRAFGALVCYSRATDSFTPQRVESLQAFAHQAAAALQNARLYQQAERRLSQLQALRNIDTAITSSLDLKVILNIILDQVTTQLQVDAANVLLLNPHTQSLRFAANRGFRSAALQEADLRLGQSHAGRAALERRTIVVPRLAEDPEMLKQSMEFPSEGFTGYAAAPLVAKGQVKGVLEVFTRQPLPKEPEWLDYFETLAGQLAIAVDSVALFDGLQRANLELSLAYDTTLEGWSRALDLRDKETEGHSLRVTELTLRLARLMGMGDAELVHMRRGALLHDIGKMGIPDSILLKPGPLTEEEWKIMKMHPVYAHNLLSPVMHLRPALPIPYSHHEKWDGTGYPRGLREDEIRSEARIFAVVDVWDALTSDRPYRSAWTKDRALTHIREQSGKHFDPAVVEAFLSIDH